MIKLSVINLKKLIRNFLKIIFLFILIFMIFKIIANFIVNFNFSNASENISNKIIEKKKIFLDFNEKDDEKKYEKILVAELSILSDSISSDEIGENTDDEIDENIENINCENNCDVETNENSEVEEKGDIAVEESITNEKIETRIISENNIKEVYTDIYKSVKIKNESKYVLNEEIVTPNLDYLDKKNLILYHTHTCESYTQTENCKYEPSGNYRTLDNNYSVVRIGNELANLMKEKGYNVIHDNTVHDYPVYNGSYNRSLITINNLHSTYNTVDMIFDIHRDALGSNEQYAPCVQIGDEKVAQIMFVIGTDGGGLEHPNWQSNLKLAIKVQEKANEMYPGLFRPIIVRNSRYNQQVSQGSAIIEVGATGNTLEECLGSMKYLSNVLNEILKN